jgi:hypothetical protein
VKLKKTATKTFTFLTEASGEYSLSRAHVFELHKKFSEVREHAKDDS